MSFWNRRTQTPQEQVTRAIDAIERANKGMVTLAHVFALLLVIATSVASLISLASVVLLIVLSGQGSVPQDTSIIITLLLVLAMDSGMLLASSQIRIGLQRGQTLRSLGGHVALMLFVALLEAGTYSYMLVLYEKPQTAIAWILIIARALAVPALSIYLSMARRNTVTTSDIAYLTELYSGVGLLRDIAEAANDPTAPLDRKIAIYRAAATLTTEQQAKLDAMRAAVTDDNPPRIVDADPPQLPAQGGVPRVIHDDLDPAESHLYPVLDPPLPPLFPPSMNGHAAAAHLSVEEN
jgi:hypothetical protein